MNSTNPEVSREFNNGKSVIEINNGRLKIQHGRINVIDDGLVGVMTENGFNTTIEGAEEAKVLDDGSIWVEKKGNICLRTIIKPDDKNQALSLQTRVTNNTDKTIPVEQIYFDVPGGVQKMPYGDIEVSDIGYQTWSRFQYLKSLSRFLRYPIGHDTFNLHNITTKSLTENGVIIPFTTVMRRRDGGELNLFGTTARKYSSVVEVGGRPGDSRHRVVVWSDGENSTLAPGGETESEKILIKSGSNLFDLYDSYADFVVAEQGRRVHQFSDPRLNEPKVWDTWYEIYRDPTFEYMAKNAPFAGKVGFTVGQIDDGWQDMGEGKGVGIFTPNQEFSGDRMRQLKEIYENNGMALGVWMAPALGDPRLRKAHPDWFVTNPNTGEPVVGVCNWGVNNNYALDYTNPEVLAHVSSNLQWLKDQGVSYFKFDFLHAFQVPGERKAGTIPSVQATRTAYQFLRDTVGEESYILGCGVPFISAVGSFFDGVRISPDIDPNWNRNPDDILGTWPSAENAVRAMLARGAWSMRLFNNIDPDSLIVRTKNSKLSSDERKLALTVGTLSGDLLSCGDNLTNLQSDEMKLLQNLIIDPPVQQGILRPEGEFVDDLPSHATYKNSQGKKNSLEFNWKNRVVSGEIPVVLKEI